MDLNRSPDRALLRSLRSAKPDRDPYQHQGYVIEQEPIEQGGNVSSATYFLTGSECRFTCSFCDLWQYTLHEKTPRGSLPQQIRTLHRTLESQRKLYDWLKLYNAANFFDPHNVPEEDYFEIASLCDRVDRVVVENHAAITSSVRGQARIRSFRQMLRPKLEIAMGLESIDPKATRRMNKSLPLRRFDSACAILVNLGIAIRVFVILQPPGTAVESSLDWAVKSCQYAFERGAERCSIIPARPGSGWTDALERQGAWMPPDLSLIESTLERSLQICSSPRRVVTVDLWDRESFPGGCMSCRSQRFDRLMTMNLEQRTVSGQGCAICDSAGVPQSIED